MTTYDPLDFHGGGYGSSWPSDDFGYERDRSYGRSSRSSRYGSGYGGGDYDIRGYGAYNQGGHHRSSYGADGRGGYGYERSVRYEHRDRDGGYEDSASSGGGHDEYRRSDYNDRGYGIRLHDYGGSSRYDNYSRGNDDRGYGRHVERADVGDRGRSGGDYGDHRTRRGERGRRDGRCSDRPRDGGGAGLIPGSGYEEIGDAITDPHLKAEWSGSVGARNVKADDPDVLKKVEVCTRPQTRGRSGRTVPLKVNYSSVEIASGPNQVFKYHVTVERSSDRDEDDKYGPQRGEQDGREHAEPGADASLQPEQRPERPLQRALVSVVVNTVLRQNNDEFAGIRVVHDGMSAVYSPAKLPWTSKTFEDVSLYTLAPPSTATMVGEGVARRRPRTFVVKMELVETIGMTSLLEHYSDPGVNVMPVLQALDVVVRHLACQRLTVVGRDLYTLKETHPLHGGKELCWGYHQAIRKAEDKFVLNLNETSAVFYTPGTLMQLVLSTLRVKDPRNARSLSKQELKALAHALRNVEVKPTHREDRARAIYGVSAEPADQLLVSIKGVEQSVAEYFASKYAKRLQFPKLPCVNVGSKRPGKETWLPVEVCEVVPGQHCANSDDLDSPAITKLTAIPPATREKNILEHVTDAAFSHDPYLAAFGMTVKLKMETTDARALEPPCVQYQYQYQKRRRSVR